jgi:hypothetical protein
MKEQEVLQVIKRFGKLSYFDLYKVFYNGNEVEFKETLKEIAKFLEQGKLLLSEVGSDVLILPREKEIQEKLSSKYILQCRKILK